jgi:TonB family protein
MKYLFIAIIIAFVASKLSFAEEIDIIENYENKIFTRFERAIKDNDAFELQKSLHIIFKSNSTHPLVAQWLRCSKIFLDHNRSLASFICFKRVNDLLDDLSKTRFADSLENALSDFCLKNYKKKNDDFCSEIKNVSFYNVEDDDFFEFIASYSYQVSQDDAYNQIIRYSINNEYLEFESNLSEADKKKLLFSINSTPPKFDQSELKKNIVYPEVAKIADIEGKVVVMVLIDVDGKIARTVVEESASEILTQAAIDAVKKTKFTPAYEFEEPIPVWTSIPVNFTLETNYNYKGMIYAFDAIKEMKYEMLDSAIKSNDEFEIQKALNRLFQSNTTILYEEEWLKCIDLFYQNERTIATFICYKRVSELILHNKEETVNEDLWNKITSYCNDHFKSIPYGKCDYLKLIKFYEVPDSCFFEFVARYSYPSSQFEAYELVNGHYLNGLTIPFESTNTMEDNNNLHYFSNIEPVGVDLEELRNNIQIPDINDNGKKGKVQARVLISDTGEVIKINIIKSDNAALNQPVIEAIRLTKFEPGKLYNIPVYSWIVIPFNFNDFHNEFRLFD